MKLLHRQLTALVIAFIFTSAWATGGTDGFAVELKAEDLAIVQAGEQIYQAQCAACHGAELEGQANWRTRDDKGFLPAPPHDATGHTWHHADDLLFEITKYGPGVVIGDANYASLMPAYENLLSDEDIISVLSYIKHTWPEDERQWQEEVNGNAGKGFKLKTKPSFIDKLLK